MVTIWPIMAYLSIENLKRNHHAFPLRSHAHTSGQENRKYLPQRRTGKRPTCLYTQDSGTLRRLESSWGVRISPGSSLGGLIGTAASFGAVAIFYGLAVLCARAAPNRSR